MDKQQIAQQILSKHKIQGYIPIDKQPIDLNSRFAELDAIASGQTTEPEKKDGIVKSIVKDVAGTLIVNPITRATSAIAQTFAPESMAAKGFQEFQDKGEDQEVLGIDVPAIKSFGQGGGKQIIGEGLKTASYLFPYGKVAGVAGKATGSKIAGNVISGATGGYVADVGYGLTDENQTVGEALTPGAGAVIGAAIPLAGSALRATGRGVSKTGEKIVETVIPVSKREAGILQTYKANNPFFKRVADVLKGTEKAPLTAGKTATKTTAGQTIPGLFGTKSQIGVQSKRASNTLWKDVISPRLKESDQAVDLDGFFAKIEDDIIKNNPELTRRNSLLEALNAVKEDYAGTKFVSLEGLQKLKEGWAKFVPEKAYQGKPIAGAFNDVRNELANEARQTIYSQLGDDVKQAYLDYGNLQGLAEMGKVSMTGQKLKGGTGGLVSELLSQAITPIGTVGGQVIYRIGKGIEFIGNLGAKNLGEALGVNLKFPGDMAVDDISKTVKNVKAMPNKQGGFIKIGQDAKAPRTTQTSQTVNKTRKNVISKTIPQTDEISKSIQKAKASGQSFDEWVKGQPTLYHGGTKDIQEIKMGKSNFQKTFYMSDNPDYAKSYGGNKSSLNEIAIDTKANLADLRKPSNDLINQIKNKIEPKPTGKTVKITRPDGSILELPETKGGKSSGIYSTTQIIQGIKDGKAMFAELQEVKQALKELGYDGLITQESKFGANYGVWNKDVLKTRSQLKALWNKAK